ncbi:unnamed protein product [Prunus brigantina]
MLTPTRACHFPNSQLTKHEGISVKSLPMDVTFLLQSRRQRKEQNTIQRPSWNLSLGPQSDRPPGEIRFMPIIQTRNACGVVSTFWKLHSVTKNTLFWPDTSRPLIGRLAGPNQNHLVALNHVGPKHHNATSRLPANPLPPPFAVAVTVDTRVFSHKCLLPRRSYKSHMPSPPPLLSYQL